MSNSIMKQYKLCSVEKYSETDKALLNPKIYNIKALIKELNTFDGDYYFRVHPKKQYTFLVILMESQYQ